MSSVGQDVDDLVSQMRHALERVLVEGFELPLHIAAISAKGEMPLGCCKISASGPHLDCQVFAQHACFRYPMQPTNMMLADRRGDAARVVIDGPTRIRPGG
jgi:hypothetical protein